MTQICNNQNGETKAGQCCQGIGGLLEPKFFKALCDPNRLAILGCLLKNCAPTKVTQVAGCCSVDISVVSRHLAVMRDAGILKAEKRGKEVFYSVRFDTLPSLLRRMAGAIEACCPGNSESKENSDEGK